MAAFRGVITMMLVAFAILIAQAVGGLADLLVIPTFTGLVGILLLLLLTRAVLDGLNDAISLIRLVGGSPIPGQREETERMQL